MNIQTKNLYGIGFLFSLLCLLPFSAMAHHPAGGNLAENSWQAFASGIFHPILGLEHLVLIAVIVALALFTGRIFLLPVLFIVGMMGGSLFMIVFPSIAEFTLMTLPVVDIGVFGSLFLLCLFFLLSGPFLFVLVFVAGMLHGLAYGEAMIGSDLGLFVSYITGLSLIQIGVYCGLLLALKWLFISPLKIASALGIVGLSVGGFGLYDMFSKVGIVALSNIL